MQFGKYELGERIAVGGMAEVFSARHFGAEGFVRAVAIKRILPNFCQDPEFVRMFINEATLAAQLRHANIVQIHDFDHVEDAYYIAMELVQGRDLRRLLVSAAEQGRRFPLELGLHVVAEACKGLMAAHELCDEEGRPLSIVHRDLSPHNMLVSFAGEVKLTDFGIAKAAALGRDTSSDVIRGKVPYMSPEQINGRELDQRTDLFSLGITLFELATGQRLYGRNGNEGLLLEVAEARIPDPAEWNAEISAGLREVVLTLLQKDPAGRYDTARAALQALRSLGGAADRSLELAAFLEELFPEEAAAARRSRTTLTQEVGELAEIWERAERERTEQKRSGKLRGIRARAVLLAVAVIVVAGGVAYLAAGLLSKERAPRHAARSAAGVVDARRPASAGPVGWAGPSGPTGRAWSAGPAAVGAAAIQVRSEPPGGAILVDGLPTRQRTPARIGVPPGRHVITVRWRSGETARKTTLLRPGLTEQLLLHRPGGDRRSARRRPAPRSAVATPVTTPVTTPAPSSGGRELSPRGRESSPRAVAAGPAARAPGSSGKASRVRFTCKPWALVTFDGRSLGQTPRSRTLRPGSYRVVFRNADLGFTQSRSFEVRGDGRDVRVRCRF